MTGTWILVTVAIAVLLGAVAVWVAHRRRMARLSPREQARRATRQLVREQRAVRGRRSRGTGEHFGKTKVGKYGDERHEGGYGDTGGDSGNDSGGGSSW